MNILANIAARCPKTIWRLRYLKRRHKLLSFSKPSDLYAHMVCLAMKHAHDPLWSRAADKYAVRSMVAELIGEKYLTKLYGAWERAEDIDFKNLPEGYVLKTANGCGTNVIVRPGAAIDIDKTRRQLNKWLKMPYGQYTAQQHYTHIPPRIIAEELLSDSNSTPGSSPADYKFYCFNGKPMYMLLCTNRVPNSHRYDRMVYDMDWNQRREFVKLASENYRALPKPECWEELKEVVAKLSQPFEMVRVDFYVINGRPVFGELTLTPGLDYHTSEFLKLNLL